jgi:cyclohexa-1,5-dienecarbonyl-CoA hydratase
MAESPIKSWVERDGKLQRVRLARPKGNIVDIEMIDALAKVFSEIEGRHELRAVIMDHEGPHFGFGASIPEHLPDMVDTLVTKLHVLIKQMLHCPIPILGVVRGQCVGGSLELVLTCNMVFASHDAFLGQPEVKLGTMAPVGSCILPERIGRNWAEDLLLSGRSVSAAEAQAIGLVNQVADDAETAALTYFDRYMADMSATGIRFATRAVRHAMVTRVCAELDIVEAIYLKELMKTTDPVEGLTAFMERRKPVWSRHTG